MKKYDDTHLNEQDIVQRTPATEEDLEGVSGSFLRFDQPDAEAEEAEIEKDDQC